MPFVNGKQISPDAAIHLGHCPECGAPITPRNALSHARSHWNPESLAVPSEARRRYDLLAEFARTDRGISKSVVQHAPIASSPTGTDAKRHPILSKDNYYDLAALPFAFEAATEFMHGDFARAILSSLIVIGIVYVVHNPENQFTTGFKKLTRSPLGAFGLLVLLLGYVAAPRVIAKTEEIFSSSAAIAPLASVTGSPAIHTTHAQPASTPAVNIDTRPHERAVDWRDFHPSWSMDLESHFFKVTQPCFLKVTAVKEHLELRKILVQIAKENSACTVIDETQDEAPSEIRDLDAMPIPDAGLSIHWNHYTQPHGESVAGWFDAIGFIVRRGDKLPENSKPTEIWIDIGPGFLWQPQS
jgi:hypothetical protein